MAHDNVTQLHPPTDYPVGARFVQPERVSIPTPMFTADELLWSCFFTGLFGVLITCFAAWVLS